MPLFGRRKEPKKMTANGKNVVLVGHCGPDMFMLKSTVSRFIPDANIVTVNDSAALREFRSPDSLLLVNRVLDGGFDTENGIELIREVTAGEAAPRAMLISNYEDAQAEAVKAGALPGFGKRNLYDAGTGNQLREALDALTA